MCINKVGISKDNLGQIINQYDIERIIINTIDILVDSSKQFIVYLNELTNEEMLSLNNFKEMIKNTRIN
jgi:K+/H+ antiporter YhaU regulatory subunit KhtT